MEIAIPRAATGWPAVVVLGVLLSGCGDAGGPADPVPSPSGGLASLPDADPPLAFGERIWLGDGYQVTASYVDGGVLYAYNERDSEITTWELATGARRGEAVAVDLEGGVPQETRQGSPYAFSVIDDRVVLLVAYEHLEPGVGTQPNAYYLRVRAYYQDDGSLAWSRDVDSSTLSDIRVLASDPDHTVIVAGARDPAAARIGRDEASLAGVTTVLDTATGQERYTWDPFIGYAMDGDVVAGLEPDLDRPDGTGHTLEGRHVFSGDTVWEAETPLHGADYFGRDAGGGLLVQPARSRGTASVAAATLSVNIVREIGTGEILFEIDHDGAAVDCQYDGEQLLVCGHDREDQDEPFLAAYDRHSRSLLWDLAEVGDGRDLPTKVTAVHRGVIYMEFASAARQPVALDARTGDDLAVGLPVAPHDVGPGYGLVYEEFGNLSIYPARE